LRGDVFTAGKLAAIATLAFGVALAVCGCGGGERRGGTAPPVNPPVPTVAAGHIGDGAAHGGRDPYLFAYLREGGSAIDDALFSMMGRFESRLNVVMTQSAIDGETDVKAAVDELAASGVDGLIISASSEDMYAVNDYCNELDMPRMYVFDVPRSADGAALAAGMELGMASVGQFMADWLDSYARRAWGDGYVPEKTGLITAAWHGDKKAAGINEGISLRVMELYPELAGNIIDAGAALYAGPPEEAAYNAIYMSLITFRGVDRWLIPCTSDEFGIAAALASERLGISDRVLIISPGMDAVYEYWDKDPGSHLAAAVAIESPVNAGTALSGLVALCDGRADMFTLWQDIRRPGDAASIFKGRLRAVTREDRAEYSEYVSGMLGQ
jgi:hypothetical protein